MRHTAFVGRRREITQIQEALASTRRGTGAVVLLAGDVGIGKTSVAQEIAQAAARLGTPAVWGPTIEAEGTPPFWCWRQVLAAVGRLAEPPQLPDLTLLASSSSQFVFFEAVVTALHQAAVPAGLLVVLDDLHWADIGSLRLLQVAAAQVPNSRLLILGTYSQPATGETSALTQVLPALLRERAVIQIVLDGLDIRDTEALVAQVLGAPVHPSFTQRLLEQTDGIPFYLVELAEGIRTDGSHGHLPESLRDIPRRRLALVSDTCRNILRAAAVIGRDFEIELLSVTTVEPRQSLLDRISEADVAGLVQELGPGLYRFVHAFVREVLYQDLAPSERSVLHAKIASAIEGLGPAVRSTRIDALAYHLRHARPLRHVDDVLTATVEAAEASVRQLAYEQAAAQYAEAVALISDDNSSDHARASLLVRLADCLYRAGDVAAWRASETAANAARDEGDVQSLAAAALIVRGYVDSEVAQPLADLCQEALRMLNSTDEVLAARLLGQMALAELQFDESPSGPSLAAQALAAARRSGDLEARFLALQAKELAIVSPDQAHARLALSEEAVQVAKELGDPATAVWAHAWRLGASWEVGRRGQADVELAALTAAVDRAREPLAKWRLEVARATLALIDGRYGHVLEAVEHALEICVRGNLGRPYFFVRVLRHLVAERTGQPTDAEDELRQRMSWAPDGRLWYAQFLVDQGRIADARDVWHGHEVPIDHVPRAIWIIGMAALAKIAAALQDRDRAAQLYEQLVPFAHLHVVRGALGGYEGPVALYCGRLAATLDLHDEAERWFRVSLETATAMGSPPFEALTRYELALLLQHSGRPRNRAAAIALLEQVLVVAERLGMQPLVQAVTADLESLKHPRGRASLLSGREVEVAGLVAEGLTNRAIGDRLSITERTAENHVKNILDKLGLKTRAQIAAWSVTQRRDISTELST